LEEGKCCFQAARHIYPWHRQATRDRKATRTKNSQAIRNSQAVSNSQIVKNNHVNSQVAKASQVAKTSQVVKNSQIFKNSQVVRDSDSQIVKNSQAAKRNLAFKGNQATRNSQVRGRKFSVSVPVAAYIDEFRRRRRKSSPAIFVRSNNSQRRKSLSFLSDLRRRDSSSSGAATTWSSSSDGSANYGRPRAFSLGGGEAGSLKRAVTMKGRPLGGGVVDGGGVPVRRRAASTDVSPERASWGFGQPSPSRQQNTEDYGALYERGPSRAASRAAVADPRAALNGSLSYEDILHNSNRLKYIFHMSTAGQS
jgi:hypothetical protein